MYKNWKDFKKAWVRALRSGEYRQGRGRLCRQGKSFDRFCCLGVAANLLIEGGHNLEWEKSEALGLTGPDGWGSTDNIGGLVPSFLKKKLQASTRDKTTTHEGRLITMNDSRRQSFNQIADYIEKEM